jgi:hypothetical protein
LPLYGCVRSYEQGHEDRSKDQVWPSRRYKLAHDRGGQAESIDPDIGYGGEEQAKNVTTCPRSQQQQYPHFVEYIADDQDQYEPNENRDTGSQGNGLIAKNIVVGIKENHIGLIAVQKE